MSDHRVQVLVINLSCMLVVTLPWYRSQLLLGFLFGASLSEPRIRERQEAVLYVFVRMFVG